MKRLQRGGRSAAAVGWVQLKAKNLLAHDCPDSFGKCDARQSLPQPLCTSREVFTGAFHDLLAEARGFLIRC